MTWRSVKYLSAYLVPALVAFSINQRGFWIFTALITFFAILPLIELFTNGSTKNLSLAEEEMAKDDRWYDYLLYGLVPLQFGLLLFFLFIMASKNLLLYEQIGITATFAIACGVLGINAAHELGHRSTKFEQFLSKSLLLTTLYMHFFIEHNRGHHKNVSTQEDPASGRMNENVYHFYLRSIKDGWISAWTLEHQRLKKTNTNFWSFSNEMIFYQIIQLILIGIIGFVFGIQVLLWYLMAAFSGIILLETVNYIEHYGLQRKKNGDRYERTMPAHSWNSNHPLGRIMLFELSRHSDHHFMASRKYQILRHSDESPQMPTGYPGMMILAMIPPAWFYVMNRKIAYFKSIFKEDVLA